MSIDKQSVVKSHLSHRTQSQIHLVEPMTQPDATTVSETEQVSAETPEGNPVEATPKREYASDSEALGNRDSNMSDFAQSAATQSVQD
jgi:hypothetical protein